MSENTPDVFVYRAGVVTLVFTADNALLLTVLVLVLGFVFVVVLVLVLVPVLVLVLVSTSAPALEFAFDMDGGKDMPRREERRLNGGNPVGVLLPPSPPQLILRVPVPTLKPPSLPLPSPPVLCFL